VTVPPIFPKKGPSGLPIPQPQSLYNLAKLWPSPPTTGTVAPIAIPPIDQFIAPQPQTQTTAPAARMTYTIASGDTAVAVAQRFNAGATKRADGRWIWKELDQATPALETTGAVPVPWQVGATLALPPAWTQDSGPRTGAKGQVGSSVSGPAYGEDDQLLTV
jgi:hypothetical protein